MNSFDFILALNQADPALVQEAMDCMYDKGKAGRAKSFRKLCRTALIAAAIACLFAALCACAYALNLFSIRDAILAERNGNLYVSIQGLQNTSEFLAYQEFLDFYEDYVAHDYYGDPVPQEQDSWMKAHERVYFCYTQTLKDKILEICEKYDLEPRNAVFEGQDIEALYTCCGVNGFILDERITGSGFLAEDDGSFLCNSLWMEKDWSWAYSCDIYRSMKGYFGQGYTSFPADESLTEYNYTTVLGTGVTIVLGEYTVAVLYDGPDAFVAATLNRSDSDEKFTRQLAEELANAVDFQALGVKSAVNLLSEEDLPAPVYDLNKEQAALTQIISLHSYGLNEWLPTARDADPKCMVNSISLSTNIYEAGWSLDQFNDQTIVFPDEESCLSFPAFVDTESGELLEGLSLVTVEVTLYNANTENDTTHQTLNNTGLNNFPNNVLWLQGGTCIVTASGTAVQFNDSVAYSGENPVPGQFAFVHIEPGETVSYRLAYVLDSRYDSMENTYLTNSCGMADRPYKAFIPLSLAE